MNREHPAIGATTARTVEIDGVELLAFHGCGYLGLAHEPQVIDAAREALARHGASGLASRRTSGNLEIHERLESRLADFMGTEAALVTEDGFIADLSALQGLTARGHDLGLLDADAHPSLVAGATITGIERFDYGPGDVNRVIALLDRHADRRPLVLTDGVFGMHGRMAPIPDILRHLPDGGLVLVDDCHGVGVLGERGRGTIEAFRVPMDHVLLTSSLSKALGSSGGFVAGSSAVIESIRRSAEAFTTTTGLAPPAAAAAFAAVERLDSEPERLERLRANIGQLHRTARRVGIRSTGTFLPVLRIDFTTEIEARRLSAALHVEGLYAPAVRYPGSVGAGAVRIAVTSEHTAHDLRRLEDGLERHLPESRD
ncbi:MAG: pyridoxal phosphate-dependent aminotransferase family protein [Planctomycetota bacterium]|nr:pyridoxal phosphate-dependent aminotransferase family protein [Planctomycetota bacterium]